MMLIPLTALMALGTATLGWGAVYYVTISSLLMPDASALKVVIIRWRRTG